MVLGNSLRGKKICLACDRGNKRGVGHFTKVVSDLNDNGCVQTQLLDIDAAGGASKEAAEAIRASINKLKLNDDDNTHLLHGQATDSGGGGAIESLHKEMKMLGLAACDYLIANCCVHSLQVQLSNAVKQTFGEGALDRVNATQLLHSAWRLQESIDLDEWRHIPCKSNEWVINYTPPAEQEQPPVIAPEQGKKKIAASESNEAAFKEDFDKLFKFHSKFKRVETTPTTFTKGSLLGKMQAPILTRWWTVGSASAYMFDYYLVVFHACQTVINMYSATTVPNIIASKLFAMMKHQETFIDLTLLRCFHKAHINQHFDWLQSCDDLSGVPGFSAHHVAVRFYLMNYDLLHICSGNAMNDCTEAVSRWDDGHRSSTEREKHVNKMRIFVSAVIDSLFKHFPRWLNTSLLRAALLSEAPIAKVIAAIILDKSMPSFESEDQSVRNELRVSGKITFKSEVHKRDVDLVGLHAFLSKRLNHIARSKIADHGVHAPQALTAAQRVETGYDIRAKEYTDEHGALRWQMQSTHLPLASQTQFVESLVKDAAHVSQTDRSEQHRSCYAIVRSATPLTRTEKKANANRITSLIKSAFDRSRPHEDWKRNQIDNEYEARMATMSCSLSSAGHFKQERLDAKRAKVDDKGTKFKRQNIAQQVGGQCKTVAVSGLVPCGKLVKARNMEDLHIELRFRGVPEDVISNKITERKEMLKLLEIERLMESGIPEADAVAHKAFKKLSTAPFKLSSD